MTSEGSGRVGGYVLGGGASRRFGQDKALARIGVKPMLVRMCDLVAGVTAVPRVVAAKGRYADLGVELLEDLWPGEGPLGGIVTGLLESAVSDPGRQWNLIVGCDMPFLTRDWLAYLVERASKSASQVVVPKSEPGLEPLCSCWRTSAVNELKRAFDGGVRKVTEAMKHLEMEILDETQWKRFDSAGRLFWNMNTQADYSEAKRILEAQTA